MPNRIIKESINESKGLSECGFFAQDIFKRLITYADDYGRFNADVQIIRARLFPRELDIVSESDIDDALIELSGVGKIAFYTSKARNEIYGCFPNWGEHQRVRDSKAKCPEPDNTEVNDWYFRRFVPIAMKVDIITRDNFKCQECGKFLTSCTDAKKFAKLGSGLYHIDHIVPCNQGGRATMENLRLTCPTCNLTRKRFFTADEIAQFSGTCTYSPQVSASRRKSLPESNPNPESKSNPKYIGEKSTKKLKRFIPPTLEEIRSYCRERKNNVDPQRFFDYFDTSGWIDSEGKPVRSWKQKIITWENRSNGKIMGKTNATSGGSSYDMSELEAIINKGVT